MVINSQQLLGVKVRLGIDEIRQGADYKRGGGRDEVREGGGRDEG